MPVRTPGATATGFWSHPQGDVADVVGGGHTIFTRFWLPKLPTAAGSRVVDKWGSSGNRSYLINMGTLGDVDIHIQGASQIDVNATKRILPGQMQSIAIVYSSTVGVTAYINGVIDTAGLTSSGNVGNTRLTLGCDAGTTNRVEAIFYCFALYYAKLNSGQLLDLHRGKDPRDVGWCKALWTFEDGNYRQGFGDPGGASGALTSAATMYPEGGVQTSYTVRRRPMPRGIAGQYSDAATVVLALSVTSVDVADYVDAVTVPLDLTAAGVDLHTASGTVYTDAATVALDLQASGADVHTLAATPCIHAEGEASCRFTTYDPWTRFQSDADTRFSAFVKIGIGRC